MALVKSAGIGLRVKSGWAAAVLVGGPLDAPRVLERCVVELSDPKFPETKQPCHASTGKEENDPTIVKRRVKVIERVAQRAMAEMLARHAELAGRLRAAALVVGSLIEPEKIANPHIRAHAQEGKIFRSVLADGLRQGGLQCQFYLEREVYTQAAAALGRSEASLRSALTALGADVGRPWGANEKLAALAGWMALV